MNRRLSFALVLSCSFLLSLAYGPGGWGSNNIPGGLSAKEDDGKAVKKVIDAAVIAARTSGFEATPGEGKIDVKAKDAKGVIILHYAFAKKGADVSVTRGSIDQTPEQAASKAGQSAAEKFEKALKDEAAKQKLKLSL